MDLEKLRKSLLEGKPIVLIDEDREVEADLVYPAEIITPQTLNFMLQAKGMLCLAMDEEEALRRGFFKLPSKDNETNFLISVDYKETFTGISAEDRALTAKKIAEGLSIEYFRYPGHLHLLGGVGINKRKGHTEASLELMEMLGFKRYALIIELLDEEGNSHNFEFIRNFAEKHELPVITIKEVLKEVVKRKSFVRVFAEAKLPSKYGAFKIVAFENQLDFKEHIAIIKEPYDVPLVRIHSECLTGDTLASLKCDCGSQLANALKMIAQDGGILLYLRQEGRGIGLKNKIKAYELQDRGLDTVEANKMLGFNEDERDFSVAYQLLKALGVSKVKLLTNNPGKVKALEEFGIEVVEVIPIFGEVNEVNRPYLEAKMLKLGHNLKPLLEGEE
ncbi:bifunctional 3,4-dihydroxy-2-butanone-4-phosphate synthase/GTP cyclohydrolase II [Thermococcus sp. M39]|uniref:bifunctional 3,4-dihydroxy-2-butanone-4-phosphate synthase/GTP cyclohydrolase II n=1 Tax=unclassified Thermococcus TaxID=2627626 RepID=UPI0014398CB4|nr:MULTISPECIES: bifunctional 3,4-dihydroxy-2-butanone-4-phosphate synthase/GTP cyclohydrolase II [unclassified Thermococcus]NJE08943.1 bifunctional 3,4-dihydroxy-2-butanone-4-phosphate synthase/GTP cyclohydrolase II [Thermococcus sp. M39]NJE12783.1 bifunctional 3,4-dihydroxy-2-butanone-4-phosphate synthase/GTP cyclohydrolase II [Thermococcus sp. LS2]